MRIAIDARWIYPQISGIGAHTRELIRYLAREDRVNNYLLLFSERALAERTWKEAELLDKPNFRPEIIPSGVFSPRSQITLPLHLARRKIEVFHSTNYMIPLASFPRGRAGHIRCVVTIHDLIPLIFPSATPRAIKARLFPIYRQLMLEIGRRADRIIAVSEASRSDIVKHLEIPPARQGDVRVIYNGVSNAFQPLPDSERPPLDATRPRVILYVGRSDPYKNLTSLVEAFALARQQSPVPLALRIVGPPDPRYPEPGQRVTALGLGDSVTWVGYRSNADLLRAYQEADVVVLPSRYEGFGLPVVEAMACGTPVVCSDIPVLREVAGEAALLNDPDDIPALSANLLRAVTDHTLRSQLIARGLSQAQKFTWEDAARKTVALYRELSA
jgi:glycosyltransferase involved in cell wall biosynthesis